MGFCLYVYYISIWAVGVTRGFTLADRNEMEEENELNPPSLPYFTVDKSVFRMNITITFVPTSI